MRVLTVNYPKDTNDEKKVKFLVNSYQKKILPLISKESSMLPLAELDKSTLKKDYASFMNQMKVLLQRVNEHVKRDSRHIRVKIGQTIFIGLLSLAVFLDLSGKNFVEQMGLAGFLFFSCINQAMMNLMGCLLIFQEQRPVFLREQANKMYNVDPYFLAKVGVELPIQIFTPLLWWIVCYFGVGLTVTAEQFFYPYLINFMLVLCASSLGYFLSSIFNQEETAVIIAPVIIMPLMLFDGFFSNSGNYQVWISWFQYISPIKYALEAFV